VECLEEGELEVQDPTRRPTTAVQAQMKERPWRYDLQPADALGPCAPWQVNLRNSSSLQEESHYSNASIRLSQGGGRARKPYGTRFGAIWFRDTYRTIFLGS
jgi:hypothetical protein